MAQEVLRSSATYVRV